MKRREFITLLGARQRRGREGLRETGSGRPAAAARPRGSRVKLIAGEAQKWGHWSPAYSMASLSYSTRLFLPSTFSTFSPVSARLRSRKFMNQSVALANDAGGRLLRPPSNLVCCKSAVSDRRRSFQQGHRAAPRRSLGATPHQLLGS